MHGVHRLADGADIRAAIAAGAKRAVVLGGGYIGLEMAEVLQTRGLEVTVVLADPLPMAQLDDDMGERVCAAMCDMGIDVQTGQPVREIEVDADGAVRAVRTDAGSYDADLVVLGLGMGPEVALAREAGPADRGHRRDRRPAHPAQPLAPARSSPPATARRPSTGSPARRSTSRWAPTPTSRAGSRAR